MYVNITRLEYSVERREDDRLTLTLRIQNDEMEYPVSPMIHGTNSLHQFLLQLDGQLPWYEKVAFPDISYNIHGSGTDGIVIRQPCVKDEYFTFPGKVLAKQIRDGLSVFWQHTNEEKRERFSGQWSPEFIEQMKREYGPRIAYDFSEIAHDRYLSIVRGTANWADRVKDVRLLIAQVQRLGNIARNSSDGKLITVHIRPDGEKSFYWWISDEEGHQLINGGIIGHVLRDDSIEYSTHT